MSTRYDNDSEDVVKENTKQTEAINKYIIGTLKMYITPEIFVKNTSGDTKKRKMPSVYYTRQYTKTPGEVQKIQKEITSEQAANKLPSGSGSSSASGTSGITTGTGTGQPPQQMQQQPQQRMLQQPQQQQQQMQRPQQLVRQPTEVMGGGAEPMYGMGGTGMVGVSGLNFQATSISNRVDPNAEPYIASLIKFSNAGFPPYSTLKSQVDTFFNLRAFRGFLKKLGNPVTIRDPSNKPIDVENALGPTKKIVDDEEKTITQTDIEKYFRSVFGHISNTNLPGTQNVKEENIEGIINFWSTNEKPQKIGQAFIFLYTIPSPQELRQQAQLSGPGRNTNVNRPMMLMVKDGNEYSLIGGYVDNTIKTIVGNTQISNESETEVTTSDVISTTIKKEFYSKTGTRDFPQSITSKYLLYKSKIDIAYKDNVAKLELEKINLKKIEASIVRIIEEIKTFDNKIVSEKDKKDKLDKSDPEYKKKKIV